MKVSYTRAILLAMAAAVFIRLFFFDFIIAQGHSMEPAIKNGTVLIVSRLSYGLRMPWQQKYLLRWADPNAGEVVVFWTPMGELAVKRCAALNEQGFFFAQGDNAAASYDSRVYGLVPVENIIGKVLGY